MLRHFFIAAVRSMAANRLQSAIAILGLAIGIAAALLMSLVIRSQLTFDYFIPTHERIYLALSQHTESGRPAAYFDGSPLDTATTLKLNLPQVEDAARLMVPDWNASSGNTVALRRGAVSSNELIYWADPAIFAVVPLPGFRGDLTTALQQPDGIVLPRATARKYFGSDDVVGRTILVDGHPMMVRAVIHDLPANRTSLQSGIFASGLAPFSPFARDLSQDFNPVVTYVRLKPRASFTDIERRLPELARKLSQNPEWALKLAPLDQLPRFEIFRTGPPHPGAATKILVAGLSGSLILLIASINFVNLLTARATRRAREVGLRKALGGGRRALMLQFLGEALLAVALAAILALALVEWLLPPLNAFLETGAAIEYWREPKAAALLVSCLLLLGLAAGAWPAIVLSSFQPAAVIKGVIPQSSGLARNGMVVFQFAILIGLAVAAAIVYQQNEYVIRAGLDAEVDQILVMRGGCRPAFRSEVRKLPGVAGAVCSDSVFLEGAYLAPVTYKGRKFNSVNYVPLDLGTFSLYGIAPLAGTLPGPADGDFDRGAAPSIVINRAMARRLGIVSARSAIGQLVEAPVGPSVRGFPQNVAARVRAVVPDFSFQSLADAPLAPAVYGGAPLDRRAMASIRIEGGRIPQTLEAIQTLWRKTHPGLTPTSTFLDDYMQQRYLMMLRQAQLFAFFAGIAIFLACLGLVGLSLATAERRTKEIGIRKAMGGSSGQILLLLLRQFSVPILLANLIAWPVAWWIMDRWLNGFAYRVPMDWRLFPAAGAAALAIAWITVMGQAWLLARTRPVQALRYE